MQKTTLCMWFDNQAEEAVDFYMGIFKNSKKGVTSYYSESSSEVAQRPAGSVMCVAFELNGQRYIALNGGPIFKFSPAMSIMIGCDTQEEIDHYYEKLLEGGRPSECGWLDDKFGVTWQVVPNCLDEMAENPKKYENAMKALMKMKKLDIAALKEAYEKG